MHPTYDGSRKVPLVLPFLGLGVAFVAYYLGYVVKKPLLACNGHMKSFVLRHMPVLQEKFWPTFWCFQSYAQTIIRSFYKSTPHVPYQRELIKMSDGGQIGLDWVENQSSVSQPFSATRPTVLILPGLTGCSRESYATHYVQQTINLGYRCVVFNYRGNGGTELLTPRTYNATNSEDLSYIIAHIHSRNPHAPLIAVGISLGGLILTNYIAKTGSDCQLQAAMTVSVAYDMFASKDSLEQPIHNILFNRLLAKNLVASVKSNIHHFKYCKDLDIESIYQSKTIREFDDRFTCKQFGYESYKEYYEDACIHKKMPSIKIPLLALNAADDPFSPLHAIPLDDARNSDNVCIVVTQHGGHVGFLEGLNPRHTSYMDRVFAQYIRAIFQHGEELKKKL